MQFLFNNLKNKTELEKFFTPVLEDLKAVNLLTRSDEISLRLLLERIDEYFLRLKERAEFFKKVRPQLLEFDKKIAQEQISEIKRLLESGEAKNESAAKVRLLKHERELAALNASSRFETFTLNKAGEIESIPVFDVSQITKDILTLLKENSLTNTARTRIVHTFKLGTAQKSLVEILSDMVNKADVS